MFNLGSRKYWEIEIFCLLFYVKCYYVIQNVCLFQREMCCLTLFRHVCD